MDKKELIKFIADDEGDVEFQQRVIAWIESSPENRKYFNRVKAEQVALFRSGQQVDAPGEFRNFRAKTKKRRRNYRVTAVAAALVVILFSSVIFLDRSAGNETSSAFSTRSAEQKDFTLPDGSKIYLNAESTLEVSPGFNRETRTVKLNGEAFFDVARNEQVPFIVETPDGIKVKVLGTSFNIKSYKDNKTIETTLVTGKVEIYKADRETPSAILAPRQKAIFRKHEKDIRVKQVATEAITSWKEGVLAFDNTPLNSVVKDIERWYGISVRIEDHTIEDYTFSGKFRKQYSIVQVLDILETSSPIQYDYDKQNKTVTLKQRN
ncbi:FecR family protein [Sinomicrobium weinanense]|uniref:DUF4974 domain-containing protein n=1 Tax=Sinomicrobium weinanense TaxID=2842200 RepID=A0A926Q2S6_9FLAO|nr:FecR domain-containing protein [Sinomicrobium weinanense]MBC9796149.1 DUF4974 domain-containing protein [Sinomicrobium weinanense]MBU3121900.1 DUF4974 domain-containing protein [Sinomicrobium weinanense]